jgi:hypothetical protein
LIGGLNGHTDSIKIAQAWFNFFKLRKVGYKKQTWFHFRKIQLRPKFCSCPKCRYVQVIVDCWTWRKMYL